VSVDEDDHQTQEAGGDRLLVSVVDLDNYGNTEASKEMETAELPDLPTRSPRSGTVHQEGSEVELIVSCHFVNCHSGHSVVML
jgi:hypothetical protein